MSFDIAPVGGTPSAAQTSSSKATAPAAPAQPARTTDGVTVDTIPATPPPEVHEAMAIANNVYENLKANGRGMHFRVDEATGRLIVEVHDLHGNLLFSVPPSKALAIAGGESLD